MATTNETSPALRSSKVRAAVVQAAPVLFDTPKSLQRLADLAADAAKQGAELVVFPEAFIGGYPKGHDFGVSLGIRSPEGPRGLPPPLRERHRSAGTSDRIHRLRRQGSRHPSCCRRSRAGWRNALLHGVDLRAGRPDARQAPQTDADSDGAGHLGQRRRLHAPGRDDEHSARSAR